MSHCSDTTYHVLVCKSDIYPGPFLGVTHFPCVALIIVVEESVDINVDIPTMQSKDKFSGYLMLVLAISHIV